MLRDELKIKGSLAERRRKASGRMVSQDPCFHLNTILVFVIVQEMP